MSNKPIPAQVRAHLLDFGLSERDISDALVSTICDRSAHPGVRLRKWPGKLTRRLADGLVFSGDDSSERYVITDFLKSGGFGEAYRAVVVDDPGRWVCIKFAHWDSLEHHEQKQVVDNFGREARMLQGLSHPSLVSLITYGQTEEERPFLVMEYVEGKTLSATELDGWDGEQRLKFFRQLAEGLSYLHGKGQVHGDLSPRNVLVGPEHTPKIIDFGMSTTTASISASIGRRTLFSGSGSGREGAPRIEGLGTPGYIAPELPVTKECSRKSDLFSLGCLLFYVMMGEDPPWQGAIQLQGFPILKATRGPKEALPQTDWEVRYHAGVSFAKLFRALVALEPEKRPDTILVLRTCFEEGLASCISPMEQVVVEWEMLYHSKYAPKRELGPWFWSWSEKKIEGTILEEEWLLNHTLDRIFLTKWFSEVGEPRIAREALCEHVSRLRAYGSSSISCNIHQLKGSLHELHGFFISTDELKEYAYWIFEEEAKNPFPNWYNASQQAWRALLSIGEKRHVLWRTAANAIALAASSAVYDNASVSASHFATVSARNLASCSSYAVAFQTAFLRAIDAAPHSAFKKSFHIALQAGSKAASCIVPRGNFRSATNRDIRFCTSRAVSRAAKGVALGSFLKKTNPFEPLWFVFQMGFLPLELINGDFLLVIPEPE